MRRGINAPNMHPWSKCSTAPNIDDKSFWNSLLKRGVINRDEYNQAFEDRAEADRAIKEIKIDRKNK